MLAGTWEVRMDAPRLLVKNKYTVVATVFVGGVLDRSLVLTILFGGLRFRNLLVLNQTLNP